MQYLGYYVGKVLNQAIPDHIKKFRMYVEMKTNHTVRTVWQTVIRRSIRKAAGEKYRSLQRHGEITEPKSRERPVMVRLEVLPPRLAAG